MQADWIYGLLGGLLIGGAAALFLLVNGRIMGASGLLGGLLDRSGWSNGAERAAFITGLVAVPAVIVLLAGGADTHITSNVAVIVAGGVVRPTDLAVIGASAVDMINQFKVDYAVIGISGIDPDGSLLDFDYREVRVAQAIMRNARQTFLVADHTKIGRNALVRLGHVSQLAAFYTDQEPAESLRATLARADVRLCVAGPDYNSDATGDPSDTAA